MWSIAALATAIAAEPTLPCTDADCATLVRALSASFAEVGLYKIDEVTVTEDAAGQRWVTVSSSDMAGLSAIAPRSDAPILLGREGYTRTVPLVIDDLSSGSTELESDAAFMKLDGIDGDSGDGGGGGGGGGGCYEVCWCTENGPECWWEC